MRDEQARVARTGLNVKLHLSFGNHHKGSPGAFLETGPQKPQWRLDTLLLLRALRGAHPQLHSCFFIQLLLRKVQSSDLTWPIRFFLLPSTMSPLPH